MDRSPRTPGKYFVLIYSKPLQFISCFLLLPGFVVDSDSKLLHSGGHNGGARTNPSGGNQGGARQSQSNGLGGCPPHRQHRTGQNGTAYDAHLVVRRRVVEDLYGVAGNDQLLVDAHSAAANSFIDATKNGSQGERQWSQRRFRRFDADLPNGFLRELHGLERRRVWRQRPVARVQFRPAETPTQH